MSINSDSIHILNGDALRAQLGSHLPSEPIVLRECLVSGRITPYDQPQALYAQRAHTLSAWGWTSVEDYHRHSASELSRIRTIAEGSEVVLWFEEDLFCQVNCWFCCHELEYAPSMSSVSLCMPDQAHRYGFGGMSDEALLNAYQQRQELDNDTLAQLAELWPLYLERDLKAMSAIASSLSDRCPWLAAAVEAERQRRPVDGSEGRPMRRCRELIEQHGASFPEVFRAFCESEAIYGYGDLQVRRLFDRIVGPASDQDC